MSRIRIEGKILRVSTTDGIIPEWIQIFPRGWIATTKYDPFLVDDEAMQAVMDRWQARGVDIVIDYEHQTESGNKAPAAGWIKELEAREDGLWGRVAWTEEAAGYIARKEYRYHSPVHWVRASDNRAIALDSIALTNTPSTIGQKSIVNKHDGGVDMDFFKLVLRALGMAGDTTEDKVIQVLTAAKNTAAKVVDILGLKPEAGPDEIETTVNALKAKADNPPPASGQILGFLELKDSATEPEILAVLQTLKSGGPTAATLQVEIQALRQEQIKRDVDDLTRQALKAGQISAAQEAWFRGYAASDLAGAKEYLAKAGPAVPTGALPGGGGSGGDSGPDEVQRQINKMMGVQQETWKKFGPQAQA